MTNTLFLPDEAEEFSEEARRFHDAREIIKILSNEFNQDILNNFEDGASQIAERNERPNQHVYNKFNFELKEFLLADKLSRPFETAFKTSLAKELEPIIENIGNPDEPQDRDLERMEKIYSEWRVEKTLRSLVRGSPETLSGFDAIIPEGEVTVPRDGIEDFYGEIEQNKVESSQPKMHPKEVLVEIVERDPDFLKGLESLIPEGEVYISREEVEDFYTETEDDKEPGFPDKDFDWKETVETLNTESDQEPIKTYSSWKSEKEGVEARPEEVKNSSKEETLAVGAGTDDHGFDYGPEDFTEDLGVSPEEREYAEEIYGEFLAALEELDLELSRGELNGEIEDIIEAFNEKSSEIQLSTYKDRGDYAIVTEGEAGTGAFDKEERKGSENGVVFYMPTDEKYNSHTPFTQVRELGLLDKKSLSRIAAKTLNAEQ